MYKLIVIFRFKGAKAKSSNPNSSYGSTPKYTRGKKTRGVAKNKQGVKRGTFHLKSIFRIS